MKKPNGLYLQYIFIWISLNICSIQIFNRVNSMISNQICASFHFVCRKIHKLKWPLLVTAARSQNLQKENNVETTAHVQSEQRLDFFSLQKAIPIRYEQNINVEKKHHLRFFINTCLQRGHCPLTTKKVITMREIYVRILSASSSNIIPL